MNVLSRERKLPSRDPWIKENLKKDGSFHEHLTNGNLPTFNSRLTYFAITSDGNLGQVQGRADRPNDRFFRERPPDSRTHSPKSRGKKKKAEKKTSIKKGMEGILGREGKEEGMGEVGMGKPKKTFIGTPCLSLTPIPSS